MLESSSTIILNMFPFCRHPLQAMRPGVQAKMALWMRAEALIGASFAQTDCVKMDLNRTQGATLVGYVSIAVSLYALDMLGSLDWLFMLLALAVAAACFLLGGRRTASLTALVRGILLLISIYFVLLGVPVLDNLPGEESPSRSWASWILAMLTMLVGWICAPYSAQGKRSQSA